MSFLDDAWSFTTAVGEGIVSVGADLYYGAERTAEGLMLNGVNRSAEIGQENELLVGLFKDLARYGLSDTSPLVKVVQQILGEYYKHIPDELLGKIAKQAGVKFGGKITGRVLGSMIAKKIAVKLATKIAATAAYKKLAEKIGLSAAASSTGVGIPIGMLVGQGVAQRASNASQRLRTKYPSIYRDMRAQKGLDLVYFLVEKPMAPYMAGIALAHQNKQLFIKGLEKSLKNK